MTEQLTDIQADIDDLEGEVARLQQEYDHLTSQISGSAPKASISKVTHEFFDDQIAPLLGVMAPEAKEDNEADTAFYHVLHEAFYRLAGVTAFPIADDTVGIRFDNYNLRTKRFDIPHYMILRSITDAKLGTLKWTVYKSTVPEFVPVSQYAHQLDGSRDLIVRFSCLVRQYLVRWHYNKEKFHRVCRALHIPVSIDLAGAEVRLGKKCRLQCSNTTIEVVDCEYPQVVQGLSDTLIEDLAKNLRGIARYLR